VPSGRPFHALDAPPVERRRWVREAFHSIANRYDLLNTVLSGGVHNRWKRQAVGAAQLGPGDVGLDVCCGTGDLVEGIAAKVGPGGWALGLDFAVGMLDVARSRARSKARARAFLICGDAETLPVGDGCIDAVTIAFGLRNVANPEQALREFHRVLRSGGRLVILEFGQPRTRLLRGIYDLYSQTIIPRLGGWLSGRRDAYQYLHDSIRMWPDPEALASMITRAGFVDVRYHLLTGGIAALHLADKS
jgi:demethylmenaquinone methyltransferase/2-methoxy-6-polyprenyl-1,4-benzoquinol methylase